MKRGGIWPLLVSLALLILSLIAIAYFVSNTGNDSIRLSGNAIYAPPIINPCNDSSIKTIWDSIFNVDSNNLLINYTSINGDCPVFSAVKNTSSEVFILTRLKLSFLVDIDVLIATNFKMTPQGISLFLSQINNTNMTYLSPYIINRTISNSTQADSEFRRVFKISPSLWEENVSGVFFFKQNVSQENNTLSNQGLIFNNYSIDAFQFVNLSKLQICNPNWQQINYSCRSDDTFVSWYNDTNICGIAPNSTYINKTYSCDFDNNGVVGNTNNIKSENLQASLFINGTNMIDLQNFTNNTYLVEIKDNGVVRASFYYNFINSLDLNKITIKKQSAVSNLGYIIVKGVDANKIIKIDKVNSLSNQVCVKDSQIDNISEVSDNCSLSDESIVNCPGQNLGFYCSIEGNFFVVSGLTHSAVEEMVSNSTPIQCISNWACSEWSSCENGVQTQSCNDLNSCNPQDLTKSNVQSCTPSCTSNWQCTNWTICSENGTQARNCTDSSSCQNSNPAKPSEINTCEYKINSNGKVGKIVTFLLVFAAVLALIAFVASIIFKKVVKSKELPPITDISAYKKSS